MIYLKSRLTRLNDDITKFALVDVDGRCQTFGGAECLRYPDGSSLVTSLDRS